MENLNIDPLVLNWNKLAMENLREEKYSEAFRLLKKAEELLKYPDSSESSKLLAITYNNLGCFFKKTEKYAQALQYLFKALDIEITSVVDKTNLAGTHLNICAIFSATSQHAKALSHGIFAVKLLKEANDEEKNISTMTSLIVALNNTGLEYENLSDLNNSLNTLKCGVDLALKHLGHDHPITQSILKSYNRILIEVTGKAKKSELGSRKKKGKKNNLPIIKILNGRNNSASFNKRISKKDSRKSYRTGSNRTFTDEKPRSKKPLPSLDRPKTIRKRKNKIVDDSKISGLEGKILDLQNQIMIYQKKYKELEKRTFKDKLSKTQAAVIIQRFWRKYKALAKNDMNNYNSQKAKIAAKELDDLKTVLKKENRLPDIYPLNVMNPNIQNKNLVNKVFVVNTSSLAPVKHYSAKKNSPTPTKLCRNIKIPLDPIRESKLETMDSNVVLIQSYFRMHLARKKYQKLKKAAIKIQRSYRNYQCYALFNFIRNAIIFIQREWRNYLNRKKYYKNNFST